MEYNIFSFPEQQIPFRSKTKKWRKRHLDFIDSMDSMNESAIRQDIRIKRINQDLTLGKLHMDDLQLVINPDGIQAGYIPDNIQHYPIINSKLNLLIGEESKRNFEYRIIVTNPSSITKMELDKKQAVMQSLMRWVQTEYQDEQQQQQELEKIGKYYTYEYQDMREKRVNEYINHFSKEQDFKAIFNDGFRDGITLGEEIYMCDIVSGEPVLKKLNPFSVKVYMSGYSNKIDDADVITITEYMSIGQIYDGYFSDMDFQKVSKMLEKNIGDISNTGVTDMGENDYRPAYKMNSQLFDDVPFGFDPSVDFNTDDFYQPYDQFGNIRVMRMFWKSRKKIKEVKKYDQMTGHEYYEWYTEQYIPDEDNGEESNDFWVNEAWEGTKIGKDIYVNMGPRAIQYNNITNPSKCHFGIVGQIYAFNGNKPFSMVDMMKPYNYLYDVVADRLVKAVQGDWGSMMTLDLAKKPKNWTVEQWLYFAKVNHLNVVDSFNEGDSGIATRVLAGGLNNNQQILTSSNVGDYISRLIQLLDFSVVQMSDVVGITKQREGQISNRETVGGVERSTLQSSHITEWVFILHNQCRKRALECFIDTSKYAARQREDKTIKFSYISSDMSQKVMEIDADEYCENDYGVVSLQEDNDQEKREQQLEQYVHAAIQTGATNFSTALKVFQSCSFNEKIRMIEQSEQEAAQRAEQAQQQQMQMQQQQIQANAQLEQARMDHETNLRTMDNETKMAIAAMQAQSRQDDNSEYDLLANQDELMEKMRQFDEKMKLENKKFEHQKHVDNEKIRIDDKKIDTDRVLKTKQINKKTEKK